MKRKNVLILAYLVSLTLSEGLVIAQGNKHKSFKILKAGILSRINAAIKDSMVIVGQHCNDRDNTPETYNAYVENLHTLSGKYPAMIGLEYGYNENTDLKVNNRFAIKYWEKGGLVTINWSADNPWTDGYNCRWNSVKNKDSINFRQLLKNAPPSKAKSNYRTELMEVGAALKELQDAGVVVLWRPFHEMNGPWFWFGVNDLKSPTNKVEYQLLWKDMYDTFTKELALSNLIWVYTPFVINGGVAASDALYPGDQYVDIVGVDVYSKAPEFIDYESFKKFGKPIVLGEIGPTKASFGQYDELEIIRQLRGKAAWFLQWSSWVNAKVAIVDNLNFKEMMNHPSVVTLDKLSK